MTKEEKLQTEVITTEQAIYCLQHIEDVDGDKCDDCPYVDVCSEKGIEGKIAQMAVKALEENEGMKAQIKKYERDIRVLGARTELLLIANKSANEKIQTAREELQSLRGCSCSCSDGIIDDVEEILDKYLGEKLERGETDGSNQNT